MQLYMIINMILSAEYGKELLEFVSENNNQSILDLGCYSTIKEAGRSGDWC